MATKRYHMMIKAGSLNAARNAIKDSVLDPRGGGLGTFSVELSEVGNGGGTWWGASWRLPETRSETLDIIPLGIEKPSFEAFVEDIIGGLSLQHNTGTSAIKIATYVHEDEFPGMSPLEGFNAALADTVKKPDALQIVEAPGP